MLTRFGVVGGVLVVVVALVLVFTLREPKDDKRACGRDRRVRPGRR